MALPAVNEPVLASLWGLSRHYQAAETPNNFTFDWRDALPAWHLSDLKRHPTRGVDTFADGLFTFRNLDDFVPSNHPLRVIRTMVNKAQAEMGGLLAQMYEDDPKEGQRSFVHALPRLTPLQVVFIARKSGKARLDAPISCFCFVVC